MVFYDVKKRRIAVSARGLTYVTVRYASGLVKRRYNPRARWSKAHPGAAFVKVHWTTPGVLAYMKNHRRIRF